MYLCQWPGWQLVAGVPSAGKSSPISHLLLAVILAAVLFVTTCIVEIVHTVVLYAANEQRFGSRWVSVVPANVLCGPSGPGVGRPSDIQLAVFPASLAPTVFCVVQIVSSGLLNTLHEPFSASVSVAWMAASGGRVFCGGN